MRHLPTAPACHSNLSACSSGRGARDRPFLLSAGMLRVMTRSLDLCHRRAGRTPRKMIVHKTTEFKPDEVEGCMEALHLARASISCKWPRTSACVARKSTS